MGSFQDLLVIDMTRYLPGGYATQVLADLGANVIKVEDTGAGDFCRHEQPQLGTMSYYIEALGRNKRSASLDLKNPEGVAAFRRLAARADVLIESFRPGVTKKLGIDFEALRVDNPRLVYCSLSGYGQDDPRSQRALHDINMQAQSGYLALNGGVKAPLHLCDLASSMVAVQSILAALLERASDGRGRHIDVSMFDSFIWWNSLIDERWCFQGGSISKDTVAFPADCCFYNIYETADGGKLAFGLIEEKFWKEFCEGVGRPDLVSQPDDAYEEVKAIVASKTLAEWEAWLADSEVCIAPVVDKDEAIAQLLAREPHMMAYRDFPRAGRVLQTNIPHAIEGMRPAIETFSEAPALGENTAAVLAELGYTPEEIAAMEESGAVRTA